MENFLNTRKGLSLLFIFSLGKWFYAIKWLQCSSEYELCHFHLKYSIPAIFVNSEKLKKKIKLGRKIFAATVIFDLR